MARAIAAEKRRRPPKTVEEKLAMLHPGTKPRELLRLREHFEMQERTRDQPIAERTRTKTLEVPKEDRCVQQKTKRLKGRDGERIGEASHPGPSDPQYMDYGDQGGHPEATPHLPSQRSARLIAYLKIPDS